MYIPSKTIHSVWAYIYLHVCHVCMSLYLQIIYIYMHTHTNLYIHVGATPHQLWVKLRNFQVTKENIFQGKMHHTQCGKGQVGESILPASQGLFEPKRKVIWKNGNAGAQSELQRFGARKKIANSLAYSFGQDAEFPEPLGKHRDTQEFKSRGREIDGDRDYTEINV